MGVPRWRPVPRGGQHGTQTFECSFCKTLVYANAKPSLSLNTKEKLQTFVYSLWMSSEACYISHVAILRHFKKTNIQLVCHSFFLSVD